VEPPSADSWAYRILAARIAIAGGHFKFAPENSEGLLLSCLLPFTAE